MISIQCDGQLVLAGGRQPMDINDPKLQELIAFSLRKINEKNQKEGLGATYKSTKNILMHVQLRSAL